MAVKRYNGSGWDTVAGVGAQGAAGASGTAPLTTKGDLLGFDTAAARLAVGNNGETLIADSSTSTGLRYTAGNAQGNPVLNSAFQVWQRGTTSTTANGYATADRWYQYRGAATASWSQVTTGLPTGFQYAMKVQRTAGQTSTDGIAINQVFETINSIPFAGKTVTLSFYAKAGANYSPTSSALAVRGYTGTGTDQAAGAFGTWTGYAEPISGSATLTTTWTRFTFTGTFASTATQFGMVFYLFGTGTAGADDSFQMTGVQLDVGSVALPFRTYASTIQGELAACQRYCYIIQGNTTNASSLGTGYWNGTTAVVGFISSKSKMRTTPTLIYNVVTDFEVLQVGISWNAVSAVALAAEANADIAQISFTTTGGTNGQAANVRLKALSTAYVGLVAEL